MGLRIDTQKVLLWDSDLNMIVPKTEVFARMITNKGSVMIEEGPLYCLNGKEVFEASMILRERIILSLPGTRLCS